MFIFPTLMKWKYKGEECMIIIVKEVRKLAREAGKQINPLAIKVLDKHIAMQIDHILRINKEKRITEKTLTVL